jgi:hypothetical protein
MLYDWRDMSIVVVETYTIHLLDYAVCWKIQKTADESTIPISGVVESRTLKIPIPDLAQWDPRNSHG